MSSPTPIPPLQPILASTTEKDVNRMAVKDITASHVEGSTQSSTPTKEDLHQVGAYIFNAINIVFDHYPDLNELGLILGMPASGLGRKGEQLTSSVSSYAAPIFDVCLKEFHESHSIPATLTQLLAANNGTPPFVVMESTKLGISFWAIPFVLKYAIRLFQQLRTRIRGMTPKQIVQRIQTQGDDTHTQILQATRILLLVNADNYTAWNARKLFLSCPPLSVGGADSSEYILTPLTELKLLNLIYSKHPKSGESWNHRRWVLSCLDGFESEYHFVPNEAEQVTTSNDGSPIITTTSAQPTTSNTTPIRRRIRHRIDAINDALKNQPTLTLGNTLPPPSNTSLVNDCEDASSPTSPSLYPTPLFQSELRMCERSCELYPKNYYSWMHRQWLVERLTSRRDLEFELERTAEWTESHINDYCGFVHRQIVWYQWLKVLAEKTPASDSCSISKGEQIARVHKDLTTKLRSWSKKYAATEIFSSAASVALPSFSSTPSSASPSPSSPSSSSSFSSSLASCSFCHPFTSIEWSHLNELQLRYPGHETLWMHRRFVWQTHIMAIMEHQPMTESTYGLIPDWVQTLIHRELDYAEFQIRDTELTNYEANKTFATIYKVWVLHSALTIVYSPLIQSNPNPILSSSRSSFPLYDRLSRPHRSWYLSMVECVDQLQPRVPSHNHWEERRKANAQHKETHHL